MTTENANEKPVGVHRFMLNLRRDLYERVRDSSYEDRSSMSAKINKVLSDHYFAENGDPDETK